MKNSLIVAAAIILVAGGYFLKTKGVNNTVNQTPETTNSQNTVPVSTGAVLDLSNQGLTKAPMYIFDRTNITELNLSNNSLGGALQSQVGQLQNLRVLNLDNNKFTGVPAEVGQLKNLEILNLSNNLLTGLPNEIGNLSKLKLLDISGNRYSEADLLGIRKNLPSSTIIKTQ